MQIRETLHTTPWNKANSIFWGKRNNKKNVQKTKHQQENPTGDDSPLRRARLYHLSRNSYLHKCRRRYYWLPQQLFELLGKWGWPCSNSVILGRKGKCHCGEEKQKYCHTDEWWTCTAGKPCRSHKIRGLQAMEGSGTCWSSQETLSENMTSFQEHKMCCKDKWNNLLSMFRANRTKAMSYVERLEIRKNFQEVRLRKQSNSLSRDDAEIQLWRSLRTSYINICQEWQTYSGSCRRPIRRTGCVPELFPAIFSYDSSLK